MEGGGGTLSEIHQTARKLLLRTRDGLERLERLEYSNSSSSSDLSFAVSKDITQIQSLCVEMSQLSRSIGAKSQRDLWNRYNTIEGVAVYDTCRCLTLTDVNTLNHVIFSNYYWCRRECPISVLHTDTLDWRKVEQIAEEAESLRESLEKYNSRNHKRMMEAKEREELLGRVNGDPSHVLRIFDDDTQAMLSVRNSARELENANALGETILSSIHGQRERLKSAHRKALDVLNTAGISNRVLRLIERRNRVDQWIKYAGMILTVIFLFAFVLWRR